jgi:hypothetical protein
LSTEFQNLLLFSFYLFFFPTVPPFSEGWHFASCVAVEAEWSEGRWWLGAAAVLRCFHAEPTAYTRRSEEVEEEEEEEEEKSLL